MKPALEIDALKKGLKMYATEYSTKYHLSTFHFPLFVISKRLHL